ncbi:MAG TPA: bifunctional 5,10-methylenetetrahydrofolate dehydrogenase/5,10-methenyltetrahydrofolate cyclohydrolase [candidate division WOR-3 bacterium]|uniref:Bifunctional protein FolD n=1 Tax=candidate division WOR-3 bacterium TaxID=2052148 RepID=A0A7V0T6E3_UNCW3|nr:bifunctional 5,10-methylenetetrahydrofolate dehydrogenase/5,10-methenyltetrahydrofolate cyclohydrolase [candidate division WOR-3 bacterium]
MKATLIDGRAIAGRVREEVRERAAGLAGKGTVPHLGIVLAGGFAPSQVYVRSKEKACRDAGMLATVARFPDEVSEAALVEEVETWNADPAVHGIIVQLPLPAGIEERRVLGRVSPDKDVDGLTPASLGLLVSGRPRFVPATPAGIIELLLRHGETISGRRVVIVGRSELVGKPLANALLLKGGRGDATVTVCHSRSADLASATRSADILVVAAGRPGLVSAEMVRPGAVVIDVGTNRVDGRLVGDVDFDGVGEVAAALTPVPGGVGPMTVAMLLHNTVAAAEGRGTW